MSSEEVRILREQLQQANNLISQLVASNNALAASAVAGAGAATGAAVTGVATGIGMPAVGSNPALASIPTATAIPSATATATPVESNQNSIMAPDDCSKVKGFIQKQMCEAKNSAKAMAGQAVGQASGMAKDAAMGFAKKKWDENKGDIMAKGAQVGKSALSSAGSQFKSITGMAAKEQKNKIKNIILPFYENDGPLKQWLDKWSNNFRERVKTYSEKENFKKNIMEALNDGLSFITEEEADEFDKIKLGEKRLRDDLKQDDVNFYFEKLKVDSSSKDKSWTILNLAEDIWSEFVKPDPSKMQQLSASASSFKDAAAKKAEGMKSSLSDVSKKAEGMKSSLASKLEIDKKINSFLGDIRNNIKSAKTSYNENKEKFKKVLQEREEKKQLRKKQEQEAKEELEKAKMAQEKQEKEDAINKLKMQIQSFEESIKQKDIEKSNLEQSKSEFQNTIQEKNGLIEKINNKKCGGFFTTAKGRAACEEKKEAEKNEIQSTIDKINQDIAKADEEIADIGNKKNEFTKMIDDANEQVKKLEGDVLQQGGRKKRRRKKRTKKKARKRKKKHTRRKN